MTSPADGPSVGTEKTYTEEDWASLEAADPLSKAVILAEKAAWDFVKELTGLFLSARHVAVHSFYFIDT